jgi:RPA family protein
MSSNDDDSDSDSEQGGAGRREVAWRVFAAEYDDSDFDYSESDEERAPNYVVTPTGARVNRLFVVGVLTEVEQVSDDVLRGRVVDPTGAFVLYAGQYQPDEMAFLESADPPAFVAVTGKARTFQPEDSDRVFTSIRPESINHVDADTRDRWVVQTAEQTLSRVSTFADALDSGERGDALRQALETAGVDSGLAAGVPLALDHYDTTKGYLAELWDLAIDSARVVAGEIDANDVGPVELAPSEEGEVTVDPDYSLSEAEATDLAAIETEATDTETTESEVAESETTETATEAADTETEPQADVESETETEIEQKTEAEPETEPEPDAEAGPETEAEPEAATSDDLGAAPTSTVDESASESEASGEAPEAETAEAETSEAHEVEDAEDAAELQDEIGTDEPPQVEAEEETTTDESVEPETEGDGPDADEDHPDLGTAGAGDEMYEFDEGEREEVEEEYGLEFSSGTEVDSPDESDLDAPEPDAGTEPEAGTESEAGTDPEVAQGGTDQHAEPTAEEIDTDEQAPEGASTDSAEAPGASIGEDEGPESDDESDESEAEAEDEEVEAEAEDDEADAGGEVAEGSEEPEDLEDTVMDRMQEMDDGDGVERELLLAAVVQDYDVTPADVEDALESALMAGRCYESGEDTLKPI